ncbi:MAG: DUF2905 domain-containing protein [Desulfohalobiaceae bacterium]
MPDWSRLLIFLGGLLIILGLGLHFLPRIPWLGRLPGDIVYERPGLKVYFPWVTCLLLSLLISLILSWWRK